MGRQDEKNKEAQLRGTVFFILSLRGILHFSIRHRQLSRARSCQSKAANHQLTCNSNRNFALVYGKC